MSFDFEKLKKASKVKPTAGVFGFVTSVRGGGKSTLCGTTGEPTLLVNFTEELHGGAAASAIGGSNITVYTANQGEDGETITNPDKVINNLNEVLDSASLHKHIKWIAIDGLSALDPYIVNSTAVKVAAAKNKYNEGPATEDEYLKIISKLRRLFSQGVNVIVTCAATGEKNENGEYVTVTPRLRGYGVCDKIIGSFDDVFVVGPVKFQSEDGSSETRHVIQFGSDFRKTGKTATGQSRTLSFNPRLTGVLKEQMPEYIEANLSDLVTFKKSVLKG